MHERKARFPSPNADKNKLIALRRVTFVFMNQSQFALNASVFSFIEFICF